METVPEAKRNRQANNPAENYTPENDTPEEETADEYEDILQEWLDFGREMDAEPKATLYRYVDPNHGSAKIQVNYFIGESIPDRHNIGLRYGSGKYQLDLRYTKKEAAQKKRRKPIIFRLATSYDEMKRKKDQEAAELEGKGLTTAAPSPAPGQSAAETLGLVRDFLAIILPQVRSAQAQPAATIPAQNTPADLMNSYAMMQKILKANLFDTAQTYQEFNRRFSTGIQNAETIEDDDQEPGEREPGLMEKIIAMIEPFFSLIAQKSTAAQVAAQTLRAAPQFTAILEDKNLCRMIIQHFDRTKGKEAADRALKNIGINRAAFFQALANRQPAAAPAGTPAAPQTRQPAARQPQTAGNAAKRGK